MKRLIVIAITIAVFAAMILPTATVMASTVHFDESFEEEDLGVGAQGKVSGSYNTHTGYLSADMYIQPLSASHKVWALIHVDLDADGNNDIGEPSVEADNTWGGMEHWFDPLELSYSGIIPMGAIVRYVVQSTFLFVDNWGWAWGATWHLSPELVFEDFEWGDDGDSLAESRGDVQWTLIRMAWCGNPVAEIDTDPDRVHTGTRSARFDRAWLSYMQASYPEDSPTRRGFHLMKDANSAFYTHTGDGTHAISVRVNTDGRLQYFDEAWKYANYRLDSDTWYFIEFRNIDWVAATYDIYVDGEPKKTGAVMWEHGAYNGRTAYYNAGNVGSELWIDDIACY